MQRLTYEEYKRLTKDGAPPSDGSASSHYNRPYNKIHVEKGGEGSGNFGHKGRQGMIGGSAPGEGGEAYAHAQSAQRIAPDQKDIVMYNKKAVQSSIDRIQTLRFDWRDLDNTEKKAWLDWGKSQRLGPNETLKAFKFARAKFYSNDPEIGRVIDELKHRVHSDNLFTSQKVMSFWQKIAQVGRDIRTPGSTANMNAARGILGVGALAAVGLPIAGAYGAKKLYDYMTRDDDKGEE